VINKLVGYIILNNIDSMVTKGKKSQIGQGKKSQIGQGTQVTGQKQNGQKLKVLAKGNTKHITSIIIIKRTNPYRIMRQKVTVLLAGWGRISISRTKSKLVRAHKTLKVLGSPYSIPFGFDSFGGLVHPFGFDRVK